MIFGSLQDQFSMKVTQQRFDRGDIRQLNTLSVINQLRRKGALSRAQIATELGLTRATVSKITLDLLDASFVEETHLVEGKTGRPGMLLSLNAAYGFIVAVEIDIDRVSIAVADFSRKIFWRKERALAIGGSAERSLALIGGLIDAALAAGSARKLKCLGIGVAWAGLVAHEEGRLVYGPSSKWRNIGLKTLWEERYKVPVFVENEANAAALCCHHSDLISRTDDLIYLSLGGGLAAGIISQGHLLRGHMGFAGQIGHVPFSDNGITCGCGRKGCWVTEIGLAAIARKLQDRGIAGLSATSFEEDLISIVTGQAADANQAARAVLIEVGEKLALGAAQLIHTFNPSTLVVGGRLGKLLKLVEAEIREALAGLALPGMLDNFEFLVSDTGEDPLIGCLAIVHDAILSDPSSFAPELALARQTSQLKYAI